MTRMMVAQVHNLFAKRKRDPEDLYPLPGDATEEEKHEINELPKDTWIGMFARSYGNA